MRRRRRAESCSAGPLQIARGPIRDIMCPVARLQRRDHVTAEEGLSVIVLTRGRVIEVVPLASSGSLVVGRGARNGLRVADPTASREHARIVWEERRPDPRITLEDLGSANGTRINNAAVRPGTPTDVSPGQP